MLELYPRMLAGFVRIFALIAVAALLANAQCYDVCVSAAGESDHTPSSACHHQKSSQGGSIPCPHQYSEISSPEAGNAKISIETTTILTLPALTRDSSATAADSQFLPQADTASPPGGHGCSTISVLRI